MRVCSRKQAQHSPDSFHLLRKVLCKEFDIERCSAGVAYELAEKDVWCIEEQGLFDQVYSLVRYVFNYRRPVTQVHDFTITLKLRHISQ